MKKVLIANRGEIAVRIARACTDAQLVSVAVYSDPDADALHVRRADEAYALNGSQSADTYLDIEKIIEIGTRAGADAVHPGYGFLAENADFAQAVIDAGMTWIGPSPQAIRALGNKVTAREIAVRAGAPLVPGTDGPVADAAQVRAFAQQFGLPVAIKAAFGGGGRGIKVVRALQDIEASYDSAVREATAAFGRGECFVERFLDKPRHVEAQVLADSHGNAVVVGTRDCSLQRRHQKLVEEAPAPFLTDEQRASIHSSAKAICLEAGYVGAGTVEYLVAPDGLISFLEVNTRLQVEHPITEETTGVDLVAEQLRIAAGQPLSFTEDPEPTGHSFEFRINAEDPARGFLPGPGRITGFEAPTGSGIRVDSGVRTNSVVPSYYDSLMAKLIVTGATRAQALRRAKQALDEMTITGVPSVLPFHRAVVRNAEFTRDDTYGVYTTWIETEFAEDLASSPEIAAAQPGAERETLTIEIEGKAMNIGLPASLVDSIRHGGHGAAMEAAADSVESSASAATLAAPMNGNLVKWVAEDGAVVAAGDTIAVLEAMKMESNVTAHASGTFTRGGQAPGTMISRGEAMGSIA
ncbi:acetyl/propionyl/methylcrotonyl-CoA carboxylase subunit alpha [Glutamicibacter protophormiae]|uniref:biotin carboxylase n=1 Tax=Glutamicibacter protophormiae TaxID=37930 RepID=A0ABS4XPV1_GLUPR|nr:biotin carboxylase N-terminal domain-containing protein [Glutamicibacter protophormiae]MBP2398539.1 acetyl-CoA/propionyl-CoA carboxylase biotin carboxyl carrier protein [Glutamicibacter protophormiae]GGL94598.1 acetyl/propionyl-CoA carboxylase subuit alpha [Glutamicibacter protophormiae]